MRHRIVPLAVLAVLGLAAFFGWRYLSGRDVATAEVLGGSGTIESDRIAITPQVAGRIVEAPEEDGVPVTEGQVLYRLDPALLQLAVDQAQSGVDAAVANYDHVRKDSGATSAEKAAAKAQRDQARVALKMAKVQLGYAEVTSPIDGVVTNIAAHAGENAVPGATLAIVSDPASLTVTIYVAEDRIGRVKLGQTGVLTTDSTDREYAARVVFVADSAEFTPSSIETKDQRVKLVYQVRLRIEDADAALKTGMPADVELW